MPELIWCWPANGLVSGNGLFPLFASRLKRKTYIRYPRKMAMRAPTIATTAMAATGKLGLPEEMDEADAVDAGTVWMPAVVMMG
jgi:hypothetical protein